MLETFPILKERMSQVARSMSGEDAAIWLWLGALVGRPEGGVCFDEVSMGLAPVIVDQIFGGASETCARRSGVSIVLRRTCVTRAMAFAVAACCSTQEEE